MPPYPWLIKNDLDISTTAKKIKAMQFLGVPYPDDFAERANTHLQRQAHEIAQELRDGGINVADSKEVIALIAYIHRLGRDIHSKETVNFTQN